MDVSLREAQLLASRVVVDLRGLEFLACAGIHTLLEADIRAECSGGRLTVILGEPQVNRVLGLTGAGESLTTLTIEADPLQSPHATA